MDRAVIPSRTARVASASHPDKRMSRFAVTGSTERRASASGSMPIRACDAAPIGASGHRSPADRPGYHRWMRSSLPTVLLILSFPAGALAYIGATQVLSALPLDRGISAFLVLVAPLFVAGLVMVPFLIPFFDRKAREDLAVYRRTMAAADRDAAAPAGDNDVVIEDEPGATP
jgi:hypothetical protein